MQRDQSADHTCYSHMVERYRLSSSSHLLSITTIIDSWSVCIKLHIEAVTVLKSSTRSPLIILRRYITTTAECILNNCSISKSVGYSSLWTRDISQSEVTGRAGLRTPAGAQLSSSTQRQGQLLSRGTGSVSPRIKVLGATDIPPLHHAPLQAV